MYDISRLPEIGDIVLYKLRETDLPEDCDKQWKGKVIKVHPETSKTLPSVDVESIEVGYEGLTELVMLFQIVEVAARDAARGGEEDG